MIKKSTYTKLSIVINIIFITIFIIVLYVFFPKINLKYLTENIKKSIIKEDSIIFNSTGKTQYYNASKFEVVGRIQNITTYSRLPEEAKKKLQLPVWEISKNSAGISIRFNSNSSKIKIRWTLKGNDNYSNITDITADGLDLYAFVENKWQFVGVAMPLEKKKNEALIIEDMDHVNREYLLNLPLFDEVTALEIGIDEGSTITKPIQKIINTESPIIFYGTSITQGASASRPGLIYTALIERYFNKEVINLGISSYGRFHKAIAECFMKENPSIIILDCTPNSHPDTTKKNLPEFIDYIRSINDTTPILLVESIIRDFAFFKKNGNSNFGTINYINEQNKALKQVFEVKSKTDENIFYIKSDNLIGNDHEATIDGTHFNDLGHFRAYELLRNEIKKQLNNYPH